MNEIIVDFDSTVGLEGRPMDDALALLYLLGRPEEARVVGVTCTFGNDTAGQVYRSTQDFLAQVRPELPFFPGSEAGEDPRSPAARFLAQAVRERPGERSILAIGSLTNLYGASLLDPAFFENVKELVFMGGITAPLLYHGQPLDELNFSVNPTAAAHVLREGRKISILTGNNTLEPSYLPMDEFCAQLESAETPSARYIRQLCLYRFADKARRYGEAGSYCWDAVAAVYLLHPELFTGRLTPCRITEEHLKQGFLAPEPDGAGSGLVTLNLPQVTDAAAYRAEMYRGWRDFRLPGEEDRHG